MLVLWELSLGVRFAVRGSRPGGVRTVYRRVVHHGVSAVRNLGHHGLWDVWSLENRCSEIYWPFVLFASEPQEHGLQVACRSGPAALVPRP